MLPSNHVEPPDLSRLLPFLPAPQRSPFWIEMEKTFSWVKYLWVGPIPQIVISLRNVYPDFQVSPDVIYQGIMSEVERKGIPGVRYSEVILHESGPFSPYRVYLRIHREFSEFFVCAAPVGNSFFVSVRNIDRFPHVRWFHYLIVAIGFTFLWRFGVEWNGSVGGIVVPLLTFTLAWSICRCAAYSADNWFTDHLPEIPLVGALYLRWFRPDTFFRQDIHAAFMRLVDGVIREVVAGIEPAPPMRPDSQAQGAPVRADLHRPA